MKGSTGRLVRVRGRSLNVANVWRAASLAPAARNARALPQRTYASSTTQGASCFRRVLWPCVGWRRLAALCRPVPPSLQTSGVLKPPCPLLYADPPSTSTSSAGAEPWRVKMLYDSDCPLCMREVNMLRRRDASNGRIKFVDIADPSYDPADNAGIDYQTAMERIHAILPDGTTVTDVEVFRRLYAEVGLGWVYAATQVPAVERAANALYGVWAKYRMQLTGRPDLEVVLAEKKACGGAKGRAVPGAGNPRG